MEKNCNRQKFRILLRSNELKRQEQTKNSFLRNRKSNKNPKQKTLESKKLKQVARPISWKQDLSASLRMGKETL